MKLYTIEDLEQRLYHYPCNSEEVGWVTYGKRWLTEQIRRDYMGKKNWNKRQSWNNETPKVWGLAKDMPYPKEVTDFITRKKEHGGGKTLIVMNESYYDNCYFDLEDKFFRQEKTLFKADTRKEISDIIITAVKEKNTELLSEQIREVLNEHLENLNTKIQSLNDSRKRVYEDLEQSLQSLEQPYIRKHLKLEEEYLAEQKRQKEIMLTPIKLLRYPKLQKLIERDTAILLEPDYISDTPDYPSFDDNIRLQMIVDRVQMREKDTIKKYRKILNRHHEEMISFDRYKYELKKSCKTQIESKPELVNNLFVVDLINHQKTDLLACL